MIIGSAVDGENYHVIRNSAGLYLSITGTGGVNAQTCTTEFGPFRSASQWYASMPDRVHLFNREGQFQSAWIVGLEVAYELLDRHPSSQLLLINGATDMPMSVLPPRGCTCAPVWLDTNVPGVKAESAQPRVCPIHPPPPINRRTAWARVLDDEF